MTALRRITQAHAVVLAVHGKISPEHSVLIYRLALAWTEHDLAERFVRSEAPDRAVGFKACMEIQERLGRIKQLMDQLKIGSEHNA